MLLLVDLWSDLASVQHGIHVTDGQDVLIEDACRRPTRVMMIQVGSKALGK